ncbi:Dolichyl-phosphate-mannose--protein mannosyltransferase 1, partial [Coemansia spiralis]
RYSESVGFFFTGWLLHWIPFFIMGRQLFLHHYLPALWMAILGLVGTLDLLTRRVSRKVRHVLLLGVLLITVRMYFQFSHLAYGTTWTREGCLSSKWLRSWDYDCQRYPSVNAASTTTALPAAAQPTAHAPPVAPPEAEHFDPLEHENKLNEPAPRIDHDKLNSNADKLNSEMMKAATMAKNADKGPVQKEEEKDENYVGGDAGHDHHPSTTTIAPLH